MQVSQLEIIIDEFPAGVQMPVRHLVGWIQENQWVRREDFSELKLAVQDLTVAQAHTEQKVDELIKAQQKLTEAQQRTELAVEQLAAAQQRTELRVEELATAQQRTELRVEELAVGQQKLTEAQQRTELRVEELAAAQQRTELRVGELAVDVKKFEERMESGFKSLADQISALGGRWGIYNEGTFRATIQGVLKHVQGVTVQEGFYGERQVDLIIRNGEHIILEITSRMHPKDIEKLYRSADDYREKTGVEPKLMVATSYVSPKLMQKIMGLERKIDIFSYDSDE